MVNTNILFRKTKKTFSSLIILALIISTLNIFYIDNIHASDPFFEEEDNNSNSNETEQNNTNNNNENETEPSEENQNNTDPSNENVTENENQEDTNQDQNNTNQSNNNSTEEENPEEPNEENNTSNNSEENEEIPSPMIPLEILDIPEVPLDTDINKINPYTILTSPLTITANGDSELDNITLYYKYSDDNTTWIREKNKTIGEIRKLTNIDETWTTLNFLNLYHSPIVVCSYNLASSSDDPAVVRVSNVTSKRCDIRIQNPGDIASVTPGDVHVIIIEEGVHNLNDGRKIEAHKYKESITAENNNWNVGTSQAYSHMYTNPVVIGQVMSQNDSRWSSFWCSNGNRANPPSSTALFTGKHVAEDTDTSRNEEIIGYIVIEAGSGDLNGINYEAALGSDSVGGVGTSPPYSYSLGASYSVGVATHNAMDGGDGGWCVLYGINPISSNLNIAIDEDMIGGSERSHTTEQVAYWLFSNEGIIIGDETTNWIKWDNPSQNPDSITPWSWNFDFPNNIGYYEFCSMGMSNDNVEKLPDIADTKCFYDIPPLDTSINEIIPYTVLSSPAIIDATNSGRDPENVTLYYRYSNDNINWDTDSSWWDNSFSRRKAISLSVPSGETPRNFTVLLNISYDSDMQSDFDDLRFISINDDVELDYWVEEKVYGNWCNVWVEIRDNITTTSQNLAWMYYGNSIVGNNSNGADTFLFFDDFNSQSYFDNHWTYPITAGSGATFTVSDGYLTINGGSAPNIATSPNSGLNDYTIDFKFYFIGSLGAAGGGVLRYNSGDWYEQELDENSLDMYRFTNINSYTNLASTPSTHQAETWYDINFKIGGDQLSAHIKQLNRTVSATDSNFATGVPGLYRWNRDCRFDDYRVRKYAIEEPGYILGLEEDNQGWIKWNDANNPDMGNPWSWDFGFPNNTGYYEFYSIAKEGGEVENNPSAADTSCYYPPIETNVENINPYLISESICTINSISTGATPEDVTLYYRYSNDNINWDTDSSWWDNSFSRRKAISLSVPSGETPRNFTVLLNISYDSDMQSDFDDLRFISFNDESVELDYWIEEKVYGNWCNVWVEIRDNITTTNQSLAWMYYGNSIVGSISSGAETFELFDDFSGSTLDSKWQINANDYSVSNGVLRINIGAITLSDELLYNLNDGYTLEGKILYHTTLGGYSGTLSGQSSQYTRSSNSGADATNLYMRSGSSVRRWTGTGSTTGYDCGGSIVFSSTDNTWYTLGAEFNENGVNLTKNRILQGSYGCGWSKDITYISLGAFHGPASYNIQDTSYDWIIIRKQVTSEPDYNISVEETISIGWNLWNNPLNPDQTTPWSWNFNFPNSSGFYEFYSIGSNNKGIEEIPSIADGKCQYMRDSSVYPISPYEITSSPLNISAFPSFIFDDVSLWYRYADDNNTWGTYPTWWDNDWEYYRKITIDHNKIDEELFNFPVLVKIDSTIAEKCDDGKSIRFIGNDNTTEFYYEIEEWNTNGDSFVWVNITYVSSTSDTTFLMYYNNSDAVDNQNPEKVWNSNFTLVQHLDETTGIHYDSTINNNDCSPQNSVNQNSQGIINGADDFDGSDDYLFGPSSNQITGDHLQTITFSAWVKHVSSDGNGIIASLKKEHISKHTYIT